MLNISNLTIHFSGTYLFDNVSFTVRPGDRIGLIGRNGTGKSTLLKIISGILQPEDGKVSKPTEYQIGYLAQEINTSSEKPVFDEAYSALHEIKTLEAAIDSLTHDITHREDYESADYTKLVTKLSESQDRYKLLGGHSAEAKVEQVLLGLGFERVEFSKLVSEFSGGWQMRVELAKILLANPDIILLDEPTNHLDIESIGWLEQFLKSYQGAVMIVSHDRTFLDNICNRTIELIHGGIYDMPLPYTRFVEARQKQKELNIAAFKNQQKQIAETEKFIERFRYKSSLASRVQSRVKQLEKVERIELEEDDASSIALRFPEPPRSARLVVETKSLSKYYDSKHVLDSIDFALERGEKAAFVGKNGEGKTTLSKIIAGTESYTGNLIYGSNVKIGYYAQHQAHLLEGDMTVFDVIDEAATGDMRTKVRSLLGAFLFSGDSVYKKVKVLSGGEKSRLALAKLLLDPVNLLILDEPTNHLDMAAKDVLKNALIEFSGALIVVSHDRDFLQGLTGKTYHFKNKKITEFAGDINYYLEKQKIDTLTELERKTVSSSNNENAVSEQSKNQSDREKRKLIQREENRLKKIMDACEQGIAETEAKIKILEDLFSNSAFFENAENAKNKQIEHSNLLAELDDLMNQWSEAGEKIEQFKLE